MCPQNHTLEIAVEWKSLLAGLMYEILTFPDLVAVANQKIAVKFDQGHKHDPDPESKRFFEERQLEYAYLGIKAHELSKKLRRAGGLPPPEVPDPGSWDPINSMAERLVTLQEAKETREAFHKEILGKLGSGYA